MSNYTSSYQRANQAKAFFMLGAVFFSLSILFLTYLIGTPYGRLASAQKKLLELQKTEETQNQEPPVAPTWQVSPEESRSDPNQEPDLAPEAESGPESEPEPESEPLPESEPEPESEPLPESDLDPEPDPDQY